MENLKTPKGFLKKGTATYSCANFQVVSNVDTSLNIFENLVKSDSENIIKISNTVVKLKKNVKYKLFANLSTGVFSTNGSTYFRFYNETTGSYFTEGLVGESVTLTYSSSNYGTPTPQAILEITPTVDTNISLKSSSGGFTLRGSAGLNYTYITIEEIEANLLPIPNILNQMIGVNQSWVDVKASRTLGTTYTNTTGKPIQVNVIVAGTGAGTVTAVIGGVTIYGSGAPASGSNLYISFIVPNNTNYLINTGAYTLNQWAELR